MIKCAYCGNNANKIYSDGRYYIRCVWCGAEYLLKLLHLIKGVTDKEDCYNKKEL